MKKLYLLCLVAGMAISVSAEQRLAKQTVMVKDTIDLSEPQYGIDEVESYFYTSGGVDYCTYYFFNYDQEFPEYRVEVKAASLKFKVCKMWSWKPSVMSIWSPSIKIHASISLT